MTEVTKSLLISQPAAAVWDALAAFDAISQWAPNVDHSSTASDVPTGDGAVRRVQLGRIALLERVTVWQPNERLSYTISGLPPAAGTVTTTWQLSPHDGGTLTTITTTLAPVPGPPGKIVGRVLARRMGSAAKDMLDGLARHIASQKEPV